MGKSGKKPKLSKAERKVAVETQARQKCTEFQEMETRIRGLDMQNQKIEARIRQYERSKRGCMCAATYLNAIEDDSASVYIQCGRAFLLSDMNQVEDDLEAKIKESDENLPTLHNLKAQFKVKLNQESANMLQLQRDFMKLGLI